MFFYFILKRCMDSESFKTALWYNKLEVYSYRLGSTSRRIANEHISKAQKLRKAFWQIYEDQKLNNFEDFAVFFNDAKKDRKKLQKIFLNIDKACKKRFKPGKRIPHREFLARIQGSFDVWDDRPNSGRINSRVFDFLDRKRHEGDFLHSENESNGCIIV